MSALIRSHAAGDQARPLAASAAPFARLLPVEAPRIDQAALIGECNALRAQLEAQTAALAQVEKTAQETLENAVREARKAGYMEGEARARQSVDALEQALGEARSHIREACTSLERLAPALAAQALMKILGAQAPQAPLIEQIVRHHLSKMEPNIVLAVEIARGDFKDAKALEQLAKMLGDGVRIVLSDTLCPGSCVMRLKLGALEIGPSQQGAILAAALLQMSEP